MAPRAMRQAGSIIGAVLLTLTLLNPGASVAAQDEPEAPAVPAPSPTPNRAPSYERGQPAGAIRIPGEPPAVGDVIVEDALIASGVIPAGFTCPTGRNRGEFVGEGYILKVTGTCYEGSQFAGVTLPPFPDLTVPDGEIRFEAKSVSGHDRLGFSLVFRILNDPTRLYALDFHPADGWVGLTKEQAETPVVPLATRSDLKGRIAKDDWNEYAVRLQGPNIWVLLNGKPILAAADRALDHGGVSLGVHRLGDQSEDAESAVVFRNLRISQLTETP